MQRTEHKSLVDESPAGQEPGERMWQRIATGMVTNYDGVQIEIPETLPMLPVRDIVVFPYMIIPLFVGRDSSIRSVEESLARADRLILLASQKDISDEHPSPEKIHTTGTVAMIMRMRKLPDGRIKILTQGLCKANIEEF